MATQGFVDAEWDYCLVLDACRYDVFEEVYDDYLDGHLEKRRANGSSTTEWAAKTLVGDLDMAYFSANPFINSLDRPVSDLKWGASCTYDWQASDHVAEVVDVWKHGWDEDRGTVPPDALTEAVLERRDLASQHDRTVVHYIQPHVPFLTNGRGTKLRTIRNGINDLHEADEDDLLWRAELADRVRPYAESVLSDSSLAMKVALWAEIGPKALRRGTREVAMELHEQNMRIALEHIADLVDHLDGDVVVTADHGEAFGEDGVWEHHNEVHVDALLDVPWLEVDT
jgi:hypothetical protein